ARDADQVVVLHAPQDLLVVLLPLAEVVLDDEIALGQKRERSVDGRLRDAPLLRLQQILEIFRREVPMRGEDLANDRRPLARQLEVLLLEVLLKGIEGVREIVPLLLASDGRAVDVLDDAERIFARRAAPRLLHVLSLRDRGSRRDRRRP